MEVTFVNIFRVRKVFFYNSVFQVAIVGITEGTKWAFALTSKSINLLVNSQAAIKAIRSLYTKSHLVRLQRRQ